MDLYWGKETKKEIGILNNGNGKGRKGKWKWKWKGASSLREEVQKLCPLLHHNVASAASERKKQKTKQQKQNKTSAEEFAYPDSISRRPIRFLQLEKLNLFALWVL